MTEVFVHSHGVIDGGAQVGAGTRVWAFAHIAAGAVVGENCNVCDHTFIESGAHIGNEVTIKCGVYLWDGLVVEDRCFIGPNATFTNDRAPRSKIYPEEFSKTLLKKGSSIGANATILSGIEVGKFALVGAGSVVTRSVPDFALVYGNPARVHGWICSCGKPLLVEEVHEVLCCGKRYCLKNGIIEVCDVA